MPRKPDSMASNVCYFMVQIKASDIETFFTVHGASGMLVAQFLDHSSNQRTDEWGGSAENRARFGLEVLKAMTGIFGRNVAVKVNPAGGPNDMGYETSCSSVRTWLISSHRLGCHFKIP